MHKYLLLTVLFFVGCAKPADQLISLSGHTMGTTYSVKYVATSEVSVEVTSDVLKLQIDKRLSEINQLMSTYIPDSELSIINKAKADIPLPVSLETKYVIEKALELNKMSLGKLDITVGPLVNLWGFGPTKRPDKKPTLQQLSEVKEFVGVDKFTLHDSSITKSHDDVYIDLSTIAKGYGVDQLAELLLAYGITNFLVEIGGEMRVAGKKPNGQSWSIAIERPVSGDRAIQRIIQIGNNAIATSGDYRNYFEEDGVRYSHLIDPTSMFPIQHKLVSVTVISDTSLMADGLATALIVLGKSDGLKVANQYNIPALFIVKEGNDFVEYESKDFKPF